MTRDWVFIGTLIVGSLSGCSDGPLEVGAWTPEDTGSGARLWLEGAGDGSVATVTVWAAELGPVFGYSLHVTYDANLFALDPNVVPRAEASVLEAGQPADAIHLYALRSDHVGLAGTRTSPALDEVAIDAPTLLYSLPLQATRGGHPPFGLDRVSVRRRDGSYLPVRATGGAFAVSGGES